ncbi:uncharacterized protein LOC123682941 [Harmonia axyridis]|uniref:uncharacterized protein LOC123682941 n=1 Tax=Harmonia axyridis TaxID=115357 RepID=UPI001E2787AC|nr:uncharacterized protein LOC123682941 [Harmonia axyridis]
MIKLLLILLAIFWNIFVVRGYSGLVSPKDEACFQCICIASSGCNDIYECAKKTINKAYWNYAGENIAGGDENRLKDSNLNYQKCTEDRICIMNTIYHYTDRVLRTLNMDVNCDGLRNCADTFAAHVFGLLAQKPESKFSIGLSKRFDRCQGHGIKNVTDNWFPKECNYV